MEINKPEELKEYYIAYFDILGYREYFKQQPDKIPSLLENINYVINNSRKYIDTINHSPILNNIGAIEIKTKIFSDNFLLCMEVYSGLMESLRLLTFIKIISDIQRSFILDYGLFVRGSIVKGSLSFTEFYVFGQGLIDAVEIEETAIYPRIIISKELVSYFITNEFLSEEEKRKLTDMISSLQQNEQIRDQEHNFNLEIQNDIQLYNSLVIISKLLFFKWKDNNWILSYINMIEKPSIFQNIPTEKIMDLIKNCSPTDYNNLSMSNQSYGIDDILEKHKETVQGQLQKYGNNNDIETGDYKSAESREKILKKYIWVMTYHNLMCDLYNHPEQKILSRCNLDSRFLKNTIEVIDDHT